MMSIGGVIDAEHTLILRLGSMIIITFGDVQSADTRIASLHQTFTSLMRIIGTAENR